MRRGCIVHASGDRAEITDEANGQHVSPVRSMLSTVSS